MDWLCTMYMSMYVACIISCIGLKSSELCEEHEFKIPTMLWLHIKSFWLLHITQYNSHSIVSDTLGFIHISLIVWLLSLESLWFSSSWFYIILALSHNRLYLCLNGFTFFPYFFFVHFMGRTKYYLTFLWDLLEIVLVHLACVVNKTDMWVMCHLNQKST